MAGTMDDDTFHRAHAAWKEKAESLNSMLRPIVQRDVDLSAPDWQEQLANMPHPADESGLREEITELFEEIVDQYETLDSHQRQAVIDLMENNLSLIHI